MEWVMKILYGLISAALVWSAVADARTRRVPRAAGWGVLAGGLAALLVGERWLEALLYAGVVLASGYRGMLPALALCALGLLVVASGMGSFPLVVGLGYVLLTFRLGWLGGGDAQLALGLIGLAGDWLMLGYLFGVYIVVALLFVLARRGLAGSARRWAWVAGHLGEAAGDPEAIRVPWAAFACLGGWAYLWLLPGLIWR